MGPSIQPMESGKHPLKKRSRRHSVRLPADDQPLGKMCMFDLDVIDMRPGYRADRMPTGLDTVPRQDDDGVAQKEAAGRAKHDDCEESTNIRPRNPIYP